MVTFLSKSAMASAIAILTRSIEWLKITRIVYWGVGMNTLTIERQVKAIDIQFREDTLLVDLSDGRSISIPLAWFPRLFHATEKERKHWRLIGKGEGIHWPDLDEDISVENILAGIPSQESPGSFKRWQAKHAITALSEQPEIRSLLVAIKVFIISLSLFSTID